MGARRRLPGLAVTGAVAMAAIIEAPSRVSASEPNHPPRLHLYSGIDVAHRAVFGHQGMVWAPAGHLHETGWRLRAEVAGGGHRYRAGITPVRGRRLSGEVLPGFQWLSPAHGVTVHVGATLTDATTRPFDPGKRGQGTRFGAKVLVEGWARLSRMVLIDGAASYATAGQRYMARLALTVEPEGAPALEPEIVAFGERGYDQLRVGLFAQLYRSPATRVLAGGGLAYDRDGSGFYAGARLKHWR